MHRVTIPRQMRRLLALAIILTGFVWTGTVHANTRMSAGAVYAMTNQPTGNAVDVFDRASNGTLTPAGTFPTGGMGSGNFEGSQNGLILSPNDQFLFATNTGSGSITSFTVQSSGLTLVNTVSSGGLKPVSVTVDPTGRLLYVLNQLSATISGFTISSNGVLTPLAGSTRSLGNPASDAAEVGFDPTGSVLVVTEKTANRIDTYTVGADGLATGPTVTAIDGLQPFGFTFTHLGGASQLLTTVSFFGIEFQGTASSYTVGADGTLQPISTLVHNTQSDTCWFVVTANQRYGYVANFGDGTVSSYSVGDHGSLTLLHPVAAVIDVQGPVSRPIDEALSNGSGYLYVRSFSLGTISAFKVHGDGSLTPVQGAGGLPPGAIGLAAR